MFAASSTRAGNGWRSTSTPAMSRAIAARQWQRRHCGGSGGAGSQRPSAAATAPDSVQEGSFHPPLDEDEGEVARALKRGGVVRIGAEGGPGRPGRRGP